MKLASPSIIGNNSLIASHTMKTKVLAGLSLAAIAGFAATSSKAATIVEDFESGLTNWSNVTDFQTPTFGTAAGNGSTTGAEVIANRGSDNLPGGYIVYTGGTVLDGSQAITGTFDFAASWTDGRYPAASFIMGDVASGLTRSPGQLVGAWLGANTFGNRTFVTDGAAATISTGSIDYRNSGEWHTVTFNWTPTSGLTGVFDFTMTNQRNGATTVVSATHTLASNEVYFGFGAGQPTAYDITTATFDNINISGTAIPEPSTGFVGALGGLLLVLRRRR